MAKRLRIDVTQEDLDEGVRLVKVQGYSPIDSCPIANALKREYEIGGNQVLCVFGEVVVINHHPMSGVYYLSKRAKDFIRRWDREFVGQPQTFIAKENKVESDT